MTMARVLILVLLVVPLIAAQSCPLLGCGSAPSVRPTTTCPSYNAMPNCCPSGNDLQNYLNNITKAVPNPACNAFFSTLYCGYSCSSLQSSYVTLTALTPTAQATYRVCSSFCDAFYAACSPVNFNGSRIGVMWPTAAAFCQANSPTGVTVSIVKDSDKTVDRSCFAGPEGAQRFRSFVYGKGLGGGLTSESAMVDIQVVDGFGTLATLGGDSVSVNITGPNRFEAMASDNGDGTYSVDFQPLIGGMYVLDGAAGSPLQPLLHNHITMSFTAASLCPVQESVSHRPVGSGCPRYSENTCCNAQDLALLATSQTGFRDTFGDSAECVAHYNKVSCGLLCSPAQAKWFEPPSVNSTSLGQLAVCSDFCKSWYTSCKDVVLSNGPVSSLWASAALFCQDNSPHSDYELVVKDSDLCFSGLDQPVSIRDSFATGAALYDFTRGVMGTPVMAGAPTSFVIHAMDIYQNPQQSGGEVWSVRFDGPGGVVPVIMDNKDGTYTVSFSAQMSGVYDIYITLASHAHDDEPQYIEHSPMTINVVSTGPSTNSLVNCFGPYGQINATYTFQVQALDQFLNPLTQGGNAGSFEVTVQGPVSSTTVTLRDLCSGIYRGSFVPNTVGLYTVLLGMAGSSSPPFASCRVTVGSAPVPPPPPPPPPPGAPPTPGPPTPSPPPGGCSCATSCPGPNVLSCSPTTCACVCRNGCFGAKCDSCPCAGNTVATGSGLVSGTAGQPFLFNIITLDALDRELSSGGAEFSLEFFDVNGTVSFADRAELISIKDNGDGTYAVAYTTHFQGLFLLHVRLTNGADECLGHVKGSPFLVSSKGSCFVDCGEGGQCSQDGTDCFCLPGFSKSNCRPQNGIPPPPYLCCPGPPRITNVVFSRIGTEILITFDQDTDQAGMEGEASCAEVLKNPDSQLGIGGYCVWSSRRVLVVHLGSQATIQVNDNITLVPNTLFSANYPSPPAEEFSSRFSFVGEPKDAFPPVAVITAPSVIGSCANLILDGTSSFFTAARLPNFQWGVQAMSPVPARFSELEALMASSSGLGMSGIITVPQAVLQKGLSYTFTLSIKNIFGKTSPAATMSVHIGDALTTGQPTLVISPSDVVISRRDALKLTVFPSIPNDLTCIGNSVPAEPTLIYTWTTLSPAGFTLTPPVSTQAYYLAPNTLQAGQTYVLKVVADYKDIGTPSGQATATIRVRRDDLVATITGGNRRFPKDAGLPLVIDGSTSFDPEASSTAMSYSWVMVDLATNLPVLGSATNVNTPILTLPAASVPLGNYRVNLTVSKSGRPPGITSVNIRVEQGGPVVSIAGPAQGILNPNQRLVLRGSADGAAANKPYTYKWSVSVGLFDLARASSEGRLGTPLNGSNLVVLPGALGGGATYTFRLEATDKLGRMGWAESTVIGNIRPSAGTCSTTPTSGVAYRTMFTGACILWEDLPSDRPLRYRLYREPVPNPMGLRFPLTVASVYSYQIKFILRPGTWVITGEVSDTWSATSVYSMPAITIPASAFTFDQDLALLQTLLQDAISNSDSDAVHQYAEALEALLSSGGKGKRLVSDEEAMAARATFAIRADDRVALTEELIRNVTAKVPTELTRETVSTAMLALERLTSDPSVLNAASQRLIVQYLSKVTPVIGVVADPDGKDSRAIKEIASRYTNVAANTLTSFGPLIAESDAQVLRDGFAAVTVSVLSDMVAGEPSRALVSTNPLASNVSVMLNRVSVSDFPSEIDVSTSEFHYPDTARESFAAEGNDILYSTLVVKANLYAFDNKTRNVGSDGSTGVHFLTPSYSELSVTGDGFYINMTLNPALFPDRFSRSAYSPICAFWDGTSFNSDECSLLEWTGNDISCNCTRMYGDYSALLIELNKPPTPPGPSKATPPGSKIPVFDDSFWGSTGFLLFIVLFFFWLCICITGLATSYIRWGRRQTAEKAVPEERQGLLEGVLGAIMHDGEGSDSEELERRDFPLPEGPFDMSEYSRSDDLNRGDFSIAISGSGADYYGGYSYDRSGEEAYPAADQGSVDGDRVGGSRLEKLGGGENLQVESTTTKRDNSTMDVGLDLEQRNVPTEAVTSRVVDSQGSPNNNEADDGYMAKSSRVKGGVTSYSTK